MLARLTSNVLLVGRNPSLSVVSRNEMAAAQSSRRQQHRVAAAKHSTSGSTPAEILSHHKRLITRN